MDDMSHEEAGSGPFPDSRFQTPPMLPSRFARDEALELVQTGADWVWETDADLRFSWLSDNYESVTGIEPARILGRFRFDFLKHSTRASARATRHLEDLQARRPFRDFVYELQGARPECRLISISGFPMYDEAGAFLGYRGVSRNVTAMAEALVDLDDPGRRGREAAHAPDSRLLLSALNAISDACCLYDADDRLIVCNDATRQIYDGIADVFRPGVSFDEIIETGIERGFWNLTDRSIEEWRAQLQARRSGPVVSSTTFRLADGRVVLHREAPTENGGRMGICTDITEQEQNARRLEGADKNSRRLFYDLERTIEVMTVGVVLYDSDLKIEIVNPAFRAIWGLPTDDLKVGTPVRALIEANRGRQIEQYDDEAWEARVEAVLEELRIGDVSPRELELSDGRTIIYSVVNLSGGKRLGTYYDVTDTKQRERELAATHERSRLGESVLDAIDDPIFVKDENLRFVFANKAFAAVFGNTPESMVGRRGADYVPAEEAALFETSERQVLETGRSYEIEESFEAPDGPRTRIVRKHRVVMDTGNRYVVGSVVDVTQLKKRETEAIEARRHLTHVLDCLPAGIIIYDQDDRFVMANRWLQQTMPGLEPAWVPGMPLRVAIEHAHDLGFFRSTGDAVLDALYDTDRNAWIELYLERYHKPFMMTERSHPDGRWYQAYDLRTADGTFIGARLDITEIKQREAALREAMLKLDLFRRVLDELPVATNIKSEQLALEYVNKAWCAMTGIAAEDAIGSTDFELFDASEATGFTADDMESARLGIRVESEEQVTHRDGTARQFMTRKSRLVSDDGTIHLVGSSSDITELKKREAMLRESLRENEVFRSLIDNVPVAIYAKKCDLKLDYVNNKWCDLTGLTLDEALGHTDIELFGEVGRELAEADRSVLETGQTHEFKEVFKLPDGSIRHQVARKGAFRASDGSLYLVGSSIDVTEQMKREAELSEARSRAMMADRAKSEFLANMSHEIRTPMNGVLGMAELLSKSNLDPKQKTFTDIIVKSGNALLTIINDILDFSKIDAGQLVLDPAPFSLAEAVEDVATLLSTRAKEKDLELIVRVAPNLQDLFIGDVGRIRQIITNLVGNAVKFTDAGHVLVDATGEEGPEAVDLRIAVTDTGIGIAPDKLDLVFEKFSQADTSSTRRHEGTGLGLAISARLVELMGGKIGVESEPGKGSTFWFTLKLPRGGKAVRRKPPQIDVTGARVLVVDDNPINRSILLEQMAAWGFDACAATSGAEGLMVLEAAADHGLRVDCLVLDYQMPTMSGLDMAALVRKSSRFGSVPIVMLTSVDQTPGSARPRELLIDTQLIKPCRSAVLHDTLVGAIQRDRARSHGKSEPEAAVETPAPAPVAAKSPPSPVSKRDPARVDILVAEDNEVNQLVFTQILAETPFAFQIVGNGRLAVEAFATMNPAMVLMDVSMPEMNGLEATAAIRTMESPNGRRIPIIGVTAHALKGDRERCLEAGMDDYLPKPISPKALLDKIAQWSDLRADERRDAG